MVAVYSPPSVVTSYTMFLVICMLAELVHCSCQLSQGYGPLVSESMRCYGMLQFIVASFRFVADAVDGNALI